MRLAPMPGGTVWVLWENRTITKQAEQAAARDLAEEHHARHLLVAVEEVTYTGSYEADLSTMALKFSDGMFRLFGEEPQSFTPTLPFIDARSHPDDVPVVMRILDQAVADKQPYHYLRRIYRADGQLRTLESHGRVVYNSAGTPLKLLGLVQDVTERKQAEEERLKQLILLQQAEDVAQLGSWEYDLVSGELSWSAGMYRLFGLPPSNTVGPEIYLRLTLAEDQHKAERVVRQLRESHESIEETLRVQIHDEVRTLKIKGMVTRNEHGEPIKILGVHVDVSDVIRLEAENLRMRLQQQQATFNAVLEAQESERQRIAEGLHNGVGQVLYATKLHLDQLRSSPPNASWQRADELLTEAISQTRRISHELTPRLLTELGLEAVLQDICRGMSTGTLRFHCLALLDEELPLPLQIGLYRLAQELTQNVVKHAGATQASLELATRPGWVVLRVEDNGRGFEPTQPMSGIGLRTLRDRVSLLGGTTHVKSSEKGTQIQLRIPLPGAQGQH